MKPLPVLDLDVVRENYLLFAKAMPDSKVSTPSQSNRNPQAPGRARGLLRRRLRHGDRGGATPRRPTVSYGNVQKESEIAAAFASASRVCDRLRGEGGPRRSRQQGDLPHPCDNAGTDWPLSRSAASRLRHRHPRTGAPPGLVAHGISFHVGSQNNVEAWDRALASTAAISSDRAPSAVPLHGQLGRRLPGQICPQDAEANPTARRSSGARALRQRDPETIVEPGRGLVGNAGMIEPRWC
jgi:ornithine decarboxylase